MSDITLYKGRNLDIGVLAEVLVDGVPTVINLTSATLKFEAALVPGDTAVILKDNGMGGEITVTDAVNGKATIHFFPGDTSTMTVEGPDTQGFYWCPSLYWELTLKDTSNNVYTLDSGQLIVRATVVGTP